MLQEGINKPRLVQIIQYLVYGTVFLIPVFFTKRYIFTFTPEKTFLFFALVEIIFFLWLVLVINNKKYLPKPSPVLISFGAFLAIYTLSGILGVDWNNSFWSTISRMTGLLLWYHLGALILVIVSTFRDSKSWRGLFSWSVYSAVIVSIVSYFEVGGLNIISNDFSTGASLIGNSSYAGIYLTMNFFLGLFLYQSSKKKQEKKRYLLLSLFILISPLILNLGGIINIFQDPASILGISRASAVGLALGFLAYVGIVSEKKILKISTFVFLGLITIFLVFLPFNGLFTQRTLEDYSGSRFVFWESAKLGIIEKPILGWGPENYPTVHYKYFQPELYSAQYANGAEVNADRAHNMYLNIAVTGGLASLAIYLLLLALILIKFANLKDKKKSAPLIGAIIAYMIFNFFLFDTLVSLLVLSIIIAFSNREEEPYLESNPKNSWWVLPLVLVPMIFFVFQPHKQQKILRDSFKGVNQTSFEELFSLTPHGLESTIRYIGEKTAFTFPKVMNNPGQKAQMTKHVALVRPAMEPYIESTDYRTMISFIRIILLEFATTDNPDLLDKSKYYESKLADLSPDNPSRYWIKAQREILEGRKEEALATLRYIEEIYPFINQDETIKIIEERPAGSKVILY